MRNCAISYLAGAAALAAALGAGPGGPEASACGYGCGHRYAPSPAYQAPPVYSYAAPPAYAYPRAYAPAYYVGTYTTRVEIFRSPRWGYAAAYYNSPPVYRGTRRRVRRCGHRAPRLRRAYVRGPVVYGWRRR